MNQRNSPKASLICTAEALLCCTTKILSFIQQKMVVFFFFWHNMFASVLSPVATDNVASFEQMGPDVLSGLSFIVVTY